MRLANFEIQFNSWVATAILADDNILDLRSFGDFTGFCFDVLKHSLLMTWRVGLHDGTNSMSNVQLTFSDVQYLEVIPRDPEMPLNKDEGLEWISYVSGYERETGSITVEGTPASDPEVAAETDAHLLFSFYGGQRIRVFADTVSISVLRAI